jgi:hypothetical protein
MAKRCCHMQYCGFLALVDVLGKKISSQHFATPPFADRRLTRYREIHTLPNFPRLSGARVHRIRQAVHCRQWPSRGGHSCRVPSRGPQHADLWRSPIPRHLQRSSHQLPPGYVRWYRLGLMGRVASPFARNLSSRR